MIGRAGFFVQGTEKFHQSLDLFFAQDFAELPAAQHHADHTGLVALDHEIVVGDHRLAQVFFGAEIRNPFAGSEGNSGETRAEADAGAAVGSMTGNAANIAFDGGQAVEERLAVDGDRIFVGRRHGGAA